MKLQEMVSTKCRCFGGSFLLVHFSGKVFDFVFDKQKGAL